MNISRPKAVQAAEILDLSLDALGSEELKKAHRAKAKLTHPDAGGNAEDFARVDWAYEALKRYLAQPKTPSGKRQVAGTKPGVCPNCKGAGRVKVHRGFTSMNMICGICHGTGECGYKPDDGRTER